MDMTEFQNEDIPEIESILGDIDVSLCDASVASTWESTIWHLQGAKSETELLLKTIISKISEANEYRQAEKISDEPDH